MAIISTTELATVSAGRKFGEAPTFTRQFVVEVDSPTTAQTDIVNSVGIVFLDPHPEAAYCVAFDTKVSNYNGSRWHYLVEWSYELPKQANTDKNPLSRPDIWKFTTSGLAVPALYYYDGDGNGDIRPLQNTANDYFEGVTTDVSVLQAHISGNRATFDFGLATLAQNALNDAPYLGGAKWCWKCEGISGQPAVEVVNEQELRYWQVEVTLKYRPDGWPLQIPNVGWNFIDAVGGAKKRVYVLDAQNNNEQVPSANPQPLNNDGSLKAAGGAPDILVRRVAPTINFSQYFGTPPN